MGPRLCDSTVALRLTTTVTTNNGRRLCERSTQCLFPSVPRTVSDTDCLRRDRLECSSWPSTPTSNTYLWTMRASAAGLTLSSGASTTLVPVCLLDHVCFGRTSLSVSGLTALFCPCIVYSRVNSRLNHLAFRGSPHPEGGDSFGPPCLCYAATCICGGAFCLQVRPVVTDPSCWRAQPPHRC